MLRVRTNVVLIIASALGYFYFYGMDSFATIFTISRYQVSKAEATVLVLVVGPARWPGSMQAGGSPTGCCAAAISEPGSRCRWRAC